MLGKSETYAFLVTLGLLGSMRRGEAELGMLKLTLVFHCLPSLSPKMLSVLAHLGCTCVVGTS